MTTTTSSPPVSGAPPAERPVSPALTPAKAPENRDRPAWLVVVISLALIVAVFWIALQVFAQLSSQKQEPPREEPQPAVFRAETYLLEAIPIQRYIAAFGTARADREVTIAAEVSGRITETQRLRVGDVVQGPTISIDAEGRSQRSGGDTLFRIDPQTYEERVKQAQALVNQDQVELRQLEQEETANARLTAQQQERLLTSQRELERFRNLLAQKAGRESDVSRAELEVQQFQEGLIRLENERDLFPIRRQQLETRASSHRSDLALALQDLEKAHVRAPFTAVVSRVLVEEGQFVRAGDPLVQLTDPQFVEVPIPVNLTDAAQIEALLQQGTPPRAELVPDEGALFRTGPRWVGQVTRVAPVADERTRTVNVFVVVDNRDSRDPLRPGTFVFARIAAEVIPPEVGFLVPRDALVNDGLFLADHLISGEEPARAASRSARRVPIHVVRTLQSFALVQGDLEAGDEIVMTNLDVITDGSLLDVRTSHTLASELKRLKVGYLAPAVPTAAE